MRGMTATRTPMSRRARPSRSLAALALAAILAPGCQTLVDTFGIGPEWIAVDASSGGLLDLEAQADLLAGRDVVFLGEVHDSPDGHALQLQLLERLGERRADIVLSLEMFERDVQPELDAYLAGELGEATFLSGARPWKNYAADYRPLVEWARARGAPVVAANVPRELARRVSQEGLAAVAGEEFVPETVDAGPGEYRDRFERAMAEHGGVDEQTLQLFFESQCLKDEVMAASIAAALDAEGGDVLVVHVCGSFHSDHRLGTVERLAARRPDLDMAVVTTRRAPRDAARLDADDRAAADQIWLVRR